MGYHLISPKFIRATNKKKFKPTVYYVNIKLN